MKASYKGKNGLTGFNLTLCNAVVKTFATDLSFSDLMCGVEGSKVLLQNFFTNHRTTYFK